MSTVNSQQSLRRTLKPRDGGGAGVPIAAIAAVVGVLLVGGGIGYAIETNHKQVAAAAPAQTAVAPVDPAPASFASVTAVTHLPKSKKPGKHGASPAPVASPAATPLPGATPSAAPTLSPAAAHKAASKHPATHAKPLAATTIAFDPAAAQATIPGPTATQGTAQTAPPATPAPAAAPQATPAYEPALVVEARFITQVQPVYPEIAKQQGIQGTTIVLATVGPTGNVISESIGQSAGNRTLDNAALDAARASRFRAPEIDGHPATETYRIVYTFSLEN